MATAATLPAQTSQATQGSFNIPIAKFPTPRESTPVDATKVASDVVEAINSAIAKKDYGAIASLFFDGGFWRDHLALTWEFRTVQGPAAILDFLQKAASSSDGFRLSKVEVDSSTPVRAPTIGPLDPEGKVLGIRFFTNLDTVIGRGQGVMALAEVDGVWKIFSAYTSLRELKGHEEGINARRPVGVQHGGLPGRTNWADRRKLAAEFKDGSEPAVFIIGAGQAGLTAAARLKAIGVDTLVIDQNDRIGDNWRKRYHQLVLHDSVWYDHMPYIPFPPQWPIFTPKDKLAEFFEAYATLLELNVWTRTDLVSTEWNEEKGSWTVVVNRRKADGTSETRTFHPRHIVQATGHSGKKNMPEIKGLETFKGDRICHSSEFSGAREGTTGKKAVVIGCCNSAHDIAQDFLENGYEVTMVQRSSTCVVSSKAIMDGLKGSYDEGGPPVDDTDLFVHGMPSSVLKALHLGVAKMQAGTDAELHAGLEKAGFRLDHGPDGSGLFLKYFQRGGGYYIDVGASQLIIDGKIKIKQGQEIAEILPHGLKFADGSELEADEVILATGYQNMRSQTRAMFGNEVADRIGDVWGFNEEGEMRTIWQRSGHPGLWLHGGNLALCRFYSRFLALHIKALEEGVVKYEDL
ncbi:probable flavin-containing monooxygenase [Cephalotrichum gorgonifer]|uniref:Probable flavin-containing monooxygenase n=1 Tax=Cephalotrichum gorgonifer TaxID=2041049 RepID=A0AAE8MS24_9PEZI|nr:probable flavin-containing monooxygenase [Cephalotrichum gorgonifer]